MFIFAKVDETPEQMFIQAASLDNPSWHRPENAENSSAKKVLL
jgi:hypothetical protein